MKYLYEHVNTHEQRTRWKGESQWLWLTTKHTECESNVHEYVLLTTHRVCDLIERMRASPSAHGIKQNRCDRCAICLRILSRPCTRDHTYAPQSVFRYHNSTLLMLLLLQRFIFFSLVFLFVALLQYFWLFILVSPKSFRFGCESTKNMASTNAKQHTAALQLRW